jgi:hypothetical protein
MSHLLFYSKFAKLIWVLLLGIYTSNNYTLAEKNFVNTTGNCYSDISTKIQFWSDLKYTQFAEIYFDFLMKCESKMKLPLNQN